MRAIVKLAERFKITFLSFLGYWAIRCIGGTLRWKVIGWDNYEAAHKAGKRHILVFWHGRIVPATWYFRSRGIVVMTSRNRDGEYIARVIRRFGYGVARGSSSRGGYGATVQTLRALKEGRDVGLTIDGPRGPRYVAKPGAAYLAWKTGNPVVPFTVVLENRWIVRSWDHFQIPKPFSRACLIIGEPIYVREGDGKKELPLYEKKIQDALDELREREQCRLQ
ncbi:MAG TPA: lysophospholipid acyltransferase family protein [Acidobacteriota bacterium]|nr:lysophospholipid acyltransferase family protein [Acidobacteriota bacterium]